MSGGTDAKHSPKLCDDDGHRAAIIMVDVVFSLDSILTAVGLVENVAIDNCGDYLYHDDYDAFVGTVSKIINAHPRVCRCSTLVFEW